MLVNDLWLELRRRNPFNKDDKWSALKTLHSLCNIDKHRSVIFPYYTLDRCSVTYHGGDDPTIKPHVNSILELELRKDAIALSVQPADAIFEVNLFVDMKLEGFEGLDLKKYQGIESDEQQVILVLRDCLSTVQTAIDCLSEEIQQHPLFGKRPPLLGLKAVDVSVETSDPLMDDMVRQLFRDLGEF